MSTPREAAVADLRRSIDVLPERTRRAMLVGITSNTVIAGAFSGGGGVCPAMAAHQQAGCTRAVSFPEAWDRYTGVFGRSIVRPATEYEVATLRAQLEASLEPQPNLLAEAIADHHATVQARRARARGAAGEPVDLGRAIEQHRETARDRRSREAEQVGLDWLFEETLVLPADFGSQATTAAVDGGYDFDAAEADFASGARR